MPEVPRPPVDALPELGALPGRGPLSVAPGAGMLACLVAGGNTDRETGVTSYTLLHPTHTLTTLPLHTIVKTVVVVTTIGRPNSSKLVQTDGLIYFLNKKNKKLDIF